MRRLLRVLAAFILLVFARPLGAHAQTIPLDAWVFQTGDRPQYREAAYDDRAWTSIAVPSSWESQGYNYDFVAWYRAHFQLDPSRVGQPLTLVLGRIDDADETWLNGVRVGGMGSFPPHPTTAFANLRIYKIPPGLLKADNVLAVRVNDMGGAGGITSGPIGLFDDAALKEELNPPPGPHASYHQPVVSNGLIAAVMDARSGTLSGLSPHIFRDYAENRPVHPALRLIAGTLDGQRIRPTSVAYTENSHVLHVAYEQGLSVDWFCPFTTGEKILYATVSGPQAAVARWRFSWRVGDSAKALTGDCRFERPGGRVEHYFLFGFTDRAHHDVSVVTRALARLKAEGGHLREAELAWMRALHARCAIPEGLSAAERNTFEQSISVLVMAQVGEKEIFPRARGQILASLPPGVWNISWVRDGYYSTLALSRLGLYDAARRMLAFELGAVSSHYVHFKDAHGKDVGVGMPYRISVCRYFGDGTEEADGGDNPNIELDGFGLFLLAFSDYVTRSGDRAFYDRNLGVVKREIADVTAALVGPHGLIRGDSGPWERHLQYKQFAWTSIVSAAGLAAFARLEAQMQSPGAAAHASAADSLRKSILANLVTRGGWIKGNFESAGDEAYDSHDGGTFEGFAIGLFDDPALFRTHMAEYARVLGMADGRVGYARINKGDAYETGEWLLMDLRAVSAFARFGDGPAAHRLVDWVTRQAALNFNLIPEMYAPDSSLYDGSIPMVGFGAGAYVLTLFDVYGPHGR